MSGAGLAWIGPALGRRAQSSTARRWTGYTTSSWLRRGGVALPWVVPLVRGADAGAGTDRWHPTDPAGPGPRWWCL